MVLNFIWIAFFFIAFIVALIRLIFYGDMAVFPAIMQSTFDTAKTGFEISLGLTGVLTFWMGVMKIGEKGGVITLFSKIIGPFFQKIFPDLPKNHPAYGSMLMNIAANMLGLDNAATPLGLNAMKELQTVNPQKDTASNPMIMFLVLNTSGLTLIPVSIMVYRTQMGAMDPSDIFLPILIATFVSTIVGLISVAVVQKINLFNRVVVAYLGGLIALVAGMVVWFSQMPRELLQDISKVSANVILFTIISLFIFLAMRKKVNVYDTFIEGAKDGFQTAIGIIPYLVAILVAIGVFRASGAMDFLTESIKAGTIALGINADFTDALPTALMKPLSGTGARGMMLDTMKTFGADSFAGRLSCIFQGACDTTFYIVAVYFGAVGIKKTRYAITCGLIADVAGIVAAIFVAYLFFG